MYNNQNEHCSPTFMLFVPFFDDDFTLFEVVKETSPWRHLVIFSGSSANLKRNDLHWCLLVIR